MLSRQPPFEFRDFNMQTDVVIVVGNVFHEFATKTGAVTASEVEALDRSTAGAGKKDIRLLFGQGVTTREASVSLDRYHDVAAASNFGQIVSRAGGHLSHKHKDHNTLIGAPEEIGERIYSAPLLIDERSELMADHQTGLHIQGMLQVEGFRQMMLAVFEKFFPLPSQIKAYAVINKMDVSFANFMFPLPADIEGTVTELDVNDRRTRLAVTMRTLQNGQECSSATLVFTFYPASVIAAKEAELALGAIERTRKDAAASNLSATARILRSLPPREPALVAE
jgi:hypothetical protein